MNYSKIYNQLIEKRRLYPVNKDKSKPYEVEYHHIIPVACNGKKDPKKKYYNHSGTNIIGLTLKEHFLAHWLLAKIYDGKFMDAMWNAFSHMCGKYSTANQRFFVRCPSRVFVSAKKNAGKYISQINRGRIKVNNGEKELAVYPDKIPHGYFKGTLKKRITINNGKITKRIPENEPIPDGFVKGDLSTKNTIWINNGTDQKMIQRNLPIPIGWKIGRLVTWTRKENCKGLIWVNNGIKQLRVKPNNIPDGFIPGCLSSQQQISNTGRKIANNGAINKFVDPNNIPDGFVLGKLKPDK